MSEKKWDVVIVGAGLSGLTAAHLLKKSLPEMEILVLEAKDRVGGRTMSMDIPAASGSDRWDFGAQWVGSTQTHILEVIKELNLKTYPQFNTGKAVQHIGGPEAKVRTYDTSIPALSLLVLLDLQQLIWKLERLCATVCISDPSKTPDALEFDSMTLHSYIEKHAWTKELKEEMGVCSRTLFGMEPSQMSFLYFLMYAAAAGGVLPLLESTPGSAQELKIEGGTQQLSEHLAERVGWKNVRLGSVVTAIWQDAEWAQVKTATETFLGRAVIVSCPPHLAARIHYKPSLPVQRQFLTQNMPVGHLIKFIITYPKAFWKENGFSGEIVAGSSTGCPFSVTYDATSPNGNAALVGFIAGTQASEWSTKEVGDRRRSVVASLVQYLGPEAEFFLHYEEKDWAQEEYSGGCPVNVMMPGMLTHYHPSLRKPCGRIHWCGTETATEWCGYMSGAVQSGKRAALEVLAELSPDCLTQEELRAIQHGLDDKDSENHLTAAKLMTTGRVVLLATLTVGAALFLSHHCKWKSHWSRIGTRYLNISWSNFFV